LEATAPAADNADQSLPDPSSGARIALAVLVLLALGAAFAMKEIGWTGTPFSPPRGDFNFALFAGFYAAAQIIERLMEIVVPWLPVSAPGTLTGAARVAQVKADRGKIALGVAALFGVVAASGFGLYFLETIGIHTPSDPVDAFLTGLLIAAGTKPLHDFISLLQNKDNPTTGTRVA